MRTAPHATPTPMPDARRSHAPRGIALLLVVVTLATATVLTTAVLMTSESTPEIGTTAQDHVTSEWAARSAANLVEAAMETTAEWRSIASAGMLIGDLSYLGATVNIAVTDLEGNAVGPDDMQVLLTVTATIGSTESVIQRVIRETDGGTYENALDPQLSEFGLYAAAALSVSNDSQISPWKASPSVRSREDVKVGIGFNSAASLTGNSDVMPSAGRVFLRPDASASLQSVASSFSMEPVVLPLNPWLTTAERPAFFGGLPSATVLPVPAVVLSDGTLAAGEYPQNVTITNKANVEIDGANGPILINAPLIPSYGLYIGEEAIVTIKGDVVMCVLADILIDEAAILLDDDATLTIYFAEDINLDDAVVAADAALIDSENRKSAKMRDWTDPRRIRFIQLRETSTASTRSVSLDENSVLVGSLHAPLSRVQILDDSIVAGRVSAKQLSLSEKGELLLDPVFDNRMGITEAAGPLYDDQGDLVAGLKDAIESTTASEGFAAALARVLAALPAQAVPDNTPDADGTTRRHARTVTRLYEWPVFMRMQEDTGDNNLFAVPADDAMAAALGKTVEQNRDQQKIEDGEIVETVVNKTITSVADALSRTAK